MKTNSRVSMAIAGVSIALSAISFAVYFAFTAVVLVSALIGVIGVTFALSSEARRTALVTAIFALGPLGQLLIETFVDSELLVLLPAILAVAVAVWAVADYSAARRMSLRTAA